MEIRRVKLDEDTIRKVVGAILDVGVKLSPSLEVFLLSLEVVKNTIESRLEEEDDSTWAKGDICNCKRCTEIRNKKEEMN